jgi:pimeloyl-ACP methyl ester carboxylesterase
VQPPKTRYARLQGDRIAYQVLGEGPPDLVLCPGSFGNLDIGWEDPGIALFCRTLASFSRLIIFDRRGTGTSDPLPPDPLPPWEAYAQELAAVLDEVGTERAALLAELDAGPTAIIFAATQPQRVRALVLSHATARFVAADDYPIGLPTEVAEAVAEQSDQLWGTEAMVAMMAPSRAGDERFRRWLGKMVRAGASPKAAQKLVRAMLEVDVRAVLPLIQAPTLVLHRHDAQLIPIEHGRYLADHIPGANLVELAGVDSTLFWETPDVALDQIEAFLAGVHRTTAPTRILATVLFTDIVDATGRASRLGGIGVQIRAGLHTGEVERRDGDVGGIAVHIAARVTAAARPGDILTSSTVRDLVVGSDITLLDRGAHRLKGVEGSWQLFMAPQP